jgi:hypothetical protein
MRSSTRPLNPRIRVRTSWPSIHDRYLVISASSRIRSVVPGAGSGTCGWAAAVAPISNVPPQHAIKPKSQLGEFLPGRNTVTMEAPPQQSSMFGTQEVERRRVPRFELAEEQPLVVEYEPARHSHLRGPKFQAVSRPFQRNSWSENQVRFRFGVMQGHAGFFSPRKTLDGPNPSPRKTLDGPNPSPWMAPILPQSFHMAPILPQATSGFAGSLYNSFGPLKLVCRRDRGEN